jgi:hypothetical protein
MHRVLARLLVAAAKGGHACCEPPLSVCADASVHASSARRKPTQRHATSALDPLGSRAGAGAGAYDVQEALAANGFAGTLDPGPLFNEPPAALLNSAYYHY